MGGTPTHWLRGNESEWTPGRVIFLDTETRAVRDDGRETLGMRLWVGSVVDRRGGSVGVRGVRSEHGTDRRSLARWVDSATVGAQTTWLYCHNLGFDLTVSRLPDQLHRLGWRMSQWTFAGRNVGGRMAKRTKRLTLADSVSLLPHSLDEVGRRLGRLKQPLPAPDAPDEVWLEYCSNDVLILAEGVLTLMDWWDREQLGHWTGSGPGCGWNALRHRQAGKAILVDTEPAGVAADRQAIRGGRRDVTRVGEMGGGPFALVDFQNAYLTVAATQLLPRARRGFVDDIGAALARPTAQRLGAVAECEIECDEPLYPLRTSNGVFYPTGRFKTVLCSPEIEHAKAAGHLVKVGAGWVHDMGYPLQAWGEWCLKLLDPADDQTPPVVKMMVKQWGRSVIGKFAARSSSRTDRGPALWPGWHLERGTSGPDHVPAADVHIGGRHWWYTFDQDGDNAYPAMLAWVESYVRVALGRMLALLGEELWVCCDTDGAVLDLTRARSWLSRQSVGLGRIRGPITVAEAVCEQLAPVTWPLVPRVKLISETLTVNGPQHYAYDQGEKAAGRPGKLEKDEDGHLRMWRWPRVAWQMAEGSTDGFVRVEATWTPPGQLAHRWVLRDGSTVPVRARISAGGATEIVPWDGMVESMGELQPASVQAPAMKGLR